MKDFQIILMLKDRKYLGLTVGLGLLMLSLYSLLQVLPQGLNNFWFWFSLLTPSRRVLYLLYGILFGLTLSFFIWQRFKVVGNVAFASKLWLILGEI